MEYLQDQRRQLLQQIQDGNMADDFDDQLRDLDAKIRARQLELNETERSRLQLEEENRRLEMELSRQPPRAVVVHKVTSIAPPPPPPPQPVRQRSKSPGGINILPQRIANLPVQRQNKEAYNYTNRDNPAFAIGHMSDEDFYNASHYPSPTQSVRPVQMSTSVIGQTYPQSTLGQSIPLQQPMYSPQPGVASTTTVTKRTEQRVSVPGGFGNPTSPAMSGGGATYRINGQTYTDSTLPDAYSHLRR